jgi:metallo-beta-lactamase family protein
MKLSFHGAAREVTGSRHLLEVNGKKILLDCGMFQGRRKDAEVKNGTFGFNPKEIDAVCLSHAHIDHSGALPRLGKDGYEGPIYSSHATKDFCGYMLMDSAYIQEREAAYINKKNKKRGKPEVQPEYTVKDTEKVLNQFKGLKMEEPVEIVPGVKLTLFNSGHILGSTLLYFEIDDEEDGKHKTLLYTGDLGRKNLPILKDPYQVEKVDTLIIESTYGDRLHEAITDVEEKLAAIVTETIARGGKLIIPAFSLGRTQEIVYTLHVLEHQGKIPSELPIWVDSPLSGNLTQVFKKHMADFDQEAQDEFINNHENPFGFGRLRYTKSVEESKALNESNMPMIIISASGMCEHGRILHHLRNNIEDPRNTVLIVGFMAQHTLGRKLINGDKEITIFGEDYRNRLQVEVIDAFSAHADRSDLIDYITKIDDLKQIFLVHGEEEQAEQFVGYLGENDITNVKLPHAGDEFTL